jgi:hypothetical protein
MSESSRPLNRRTPVSSRDDEFMDGSPAATRLPVMNGHSAPPVLDSVDPLTRQLRQMYGAIADEPIPEAIAALMERLKG